MKFSSTLLLVTILLVQSLGIFADSANAQDKYAVLVGVETYDPGTFQNLEFTEDDAIKLGTLLSSLDYQTTVMTSQTKSAKLTPYNAENIITAIKTRANSCTNGDTLIVSLSGHGVQFADEEALESGIKETYFCPQSADISDKSTLVPISQLMEMINSSKASRKLLLVDSCRNEIVSEAGRKKSAARKIQLESVHENRRSVPGGMSVLFSCSSEQVSWEHVELKQSVFSHYVAEYLEGKADERFYENGQFTLDGLVFFVRKKTNDFVFENNLSSDGQLPVLRGSSANWPLATIKELPNYGDASFELKSSHAKLGFAEAQFTLAYEYESGKSVKLNYELAKHWYKKAADQGHSNAQNNYGKLYHEALGVKQDYSEAMKWYRKAAEQRNPIGQTNVGTLYRYGLGVEQNLIEARKFFLQAANNGSKIAQRSLAEMYHSGDGGKLDYAQAMKWYVKAADQGDAEAQHGIGLLFGNGQGVTLDYKQALKWFRLAADQNHSEAQRVVGFLFFQGIDVEKNDKEAVKWFRKSATQDNPKACHNLAHMYQYGLGVTQNYSQAIHWYEKAVQLGVGRSANELGRLYYDGSGVELNYALAKKWFEVGVSLNEPASMFNMGLIYSTGNGVIKDLNEAKKWYRKAADLGFEQAKEELAKMGV